MGMSGLREHAIYFVAAAKEEYRAGPSKCVYANTHSTAHHNIRVDNDCTVQYIHYITSLVMYSAIYTLYNISGYPQCNIYTI